MDKLEIGPVPGDEECEQLGSNYNPEVARAECRLFIRAIRQELGEPPEGAQLVITSNRHDFGTYYEVAVKFDEGDEAAVNYAFKVEGQAPTTWPHDMRAEAEALRSGDLSSVRRYRGG